MFPTAHSPTSVIFTVVADSRKRNTARCNRSGGREARGDGGLLLAQAAESEADDQGERWSCKRRGGDGNVGVGVLATYGFGMQASKSSS